MHSNVFELHESKKKNVHVRMKFAQPWYDIQDIFDLTRRCFHFIICSLHRHCLNIIGFDYNYECTTDKKNICIRATYIPKMFCLIYRNTIDQASVPFLAGWFNGSSKRWTKHTCLHACRHRRRLSHMHHKIDLKHQSIGAFVVFRVYIWFTSENKCHCRS